MKKSIGQKICIYIGAVIVAFFVLTPFLWLIISSISYQRNLTALPLKIIPTEITFQKYIDVFTNADNAIAYTFRIAMKNSLLVACFASIIALITGTLAAYAFARLKFRFRQKLIYLFLFTYMIPPIVIVIPLYLMLNKMGLLDQKITLVLLYCTTAVPFVIWVMQGYFNQIPKSFEDAAIIDGCTRLQTLRYIILPIVSGGLMATAIMAFLLAWDEFFFSNIFTSSLHAKTISVAIAEFSGKNEVDYGMIACGGVIAALPPLIIAFVFQKYLVKGVMAGGSKE